MGTRDSWIDTPAAFGALCARLGAEREIGLDTESDGFHHYFDKLCLLQISTRSENFLVDSLAVGSLEPLRPVLEDRALTKVLHASEQDLMYFRRDHRLSVLGLFNTLLAAQLVGQTHLGLASLLQDYFQVSLSKESQRDDWSRRPLTPTQLTYAVEDTRHLLPLADRLRTLLDAEGRTRWAEEEFLAQEERSWIMEPVDPDDLTRIKGWRALPPRSRAVLRELLRARDAEARRANRPPFRIVGNASLLELAARPPASVGELAKTKGFPRYGGGRLADLLFGAVRRGLEMSEEEFPGDPSRGPHRPLPRLEAIVEVRLSRLKEWRLLTAKKLALDPGVVAPLRDLEMLASEPPDTVQRLEQQPWTAIRAWRRREFGPEWVRLLGG